MKPCVRCGTPAEDVEFAERGATFAIKPVCTACLDGCLRRLDVLRVEFEALLEQGINRELANEVMVDRIARRHEQLARGMV